MPVKGQGARVLRAGAVYFALVFAAGFVLGPIRVLWLLPRVGERAAELIEMPVMLVVLVLAARWVVRRFGLGRAWAARLGVGLVAFALLVAAELAVVLRLRGLTVGEYLAGRDLVAGSVYAVMLGVFAVMPWVVGRRRNGSQLGTRRGVSAGMSQ
jgi:hypothetical protein